MTENPSTSPYIYCPHIEDPGPGKWASSGYMLQLVARTDKAHGSYLILCDACKSTILDHMLVSVINRLEDKKRREQPCAHMAPELLRTETIMQDDRILAIIRIFHCKMCLSEYVTVEVTDKKAALVTPEMLEKVIQGVVS